MEADALSSFPHFAQQNISNPAATGLILDV